MKPHNLAENIERNVREKMVKWKAIRNMIASPPLILCFPTTFNTILRNKWNLNFLRKMQFLMWNLICRLPLLMFRWRFVRVCTRRVGWVYFTLTKDCCWLSEFTWLGRLDTSKFRPLTTHSISDFLYTALLLRAWVWSFWQICYRSK